MEDNISVDSIETQPQPTQDKPHPATEQDISNKAQRLHASVLDAQQALIDAMLTDKECLKDPKVIRVFNEVLTSASTSALGTKKLKLEKDNGDNQQALTAMMLAIANGDKGAIGYVNKIIDQTPKDAVTPPHIDSSIKFNPQALQQGNVTITLEELQSHVTQKSIDQLK
jgi:hypothetical protein